MRGRQTALAMVVGGMVLVATGCGWADGGSAEAVDAAGPSVAVDVATAETVAMQTMTSDGFTMQLPADWEEQDLSNQTFIDMDGTQPEFRRHYALSDRSGAVNRAFLEYTAGPQPEKEEMAAPEEVVRRVQESVSFTASLPVEELRYILQDEGLGCMDGLELLTDPAPREGSGEPGRHTAYQFEYLCSNGGYPVHGWALIAVSPDGRAHQAYLTAEENYWRNNRDVMEQAIASVSVPD